LAHQAELTAKTVNKCPEFKEYFSDLRQFINACKTQPGLQKLDELKLKIPETPIEVRFHSYYSSMKTLTDNEDGYRALAEIGIYMKSATWAFLKEYVIFYELLYLLTMLLQQDALTLRK